MVKMYREPARSYCMAPPARPPPLTVYRKPPLLFVRYPHTAARAPQRSCLSARSTLRQGVLGGHTNGACEALHAVCEVRALCSTTISKSLARPRQLYAGGGWPTCGATSRQAPSPSSLTLTKRECGGALAGKGT